MKSFLFWVVLLAFIVRLLFNVFVVGFKTAPINDAKEYHQIAQNICKGEGFKLRGKVTSYRAPLFPLSLAALYKVFGENLTVARLFLCILGALLVFLLYRVVCMEFNEGVAKLAAVIACFYPHLVWWTGLLLSETLFSTLLCAAILFLLKTFKERKIRDAILAGAFLGMGTLTRPILLLFLPFLFLWFYRRRQMKAFLIIIGLFLLVTAPWNIRNYFLHEGLVPITTGGGLTFWGANNPVIIKDERMVGTWLKWDALPFWDYLKKLPEVERDRESYILGLAFLWNNKKEVPRLLYHKMRRFWSLYPHTTRAQKIISLLSYGLLFPFFIFGLVLYRRSPSRLFYYLILFFCAAALIFYGCLRFRSPLEPYIIAISANAILWLYRRRRWGASAGMHTS
jgi:4-amino-4-deoxy-L-arabinose transferase-like glycosyltransferase